MLETHPLFEILSQRRSVRQFASTPVPQEILMELVKAAGLAPSGSNKQSWRFIIVQTPEIIAQAAEEVEKACLNLNKKMNPEFRQDFTLYAQYFLHFRFAPVLIVPIFRNSIGFSRAFDPALYPQEYTQMVEMEEHTTIMSISLAIENLLLAAQTLQLGACCMTGPLIARESLNKVFRVPEQWHMALVIPVGYAAVIPGNPGRKEVASIIKWL